MGRRPGTAPSMPSAACTASPSGRMATAAPQALLTDTLGLQTRQARRVTDCRFESATEGAGTSSIFDASPGFWSGVDRRRAPSTTWRSGPRRTTMQIAAARRRSTARPGRHAGASIGGTSARSTSGAGWCPVRDRDRRAGLRDRRDRRRARAPDFSCPRSYETMRDELEHRLPPLRPAEIAAPESSERRRGPRIHATVSSPAPTGRAAAAAAARHRWQRGRPAAPWARPSPGGGAAESAWPGAGERHAAILPPAGGGCLRPGRSADPRPPSSPTSWTNARPDLWPRPAHRGRISRTAPTSPRRCSCFGRAALRRRAAAPADGTAGSRSAALDLDGVPVEIIAGRADPIVRPEQSEALADLSPEERRAGAT